MKFAKRLISTCIIAALGVSATYANSQPALLPELGVDMRFEVLRLPNFPLNLIKEGYTDGSVRIAVDIDYSGELRDWIVLESTHPDFVKAVERVIDKWRFTAPHIDGENRSIATEFNIRFQSEGSVISTSGIMNMLSQRINELSGFRKHYQRVAHVDEIDATPLAIDQINPRIPNDLAKEHDGARAVFNFYVDENGFVRIPTLASTDGDPHVDLLIAAQDALSQWRFDPPTRNKEPVKIQLSQAFIFTHQ